MNAKNTQRIITWINKEPDNSFINPGYSPVFSDEQIQLGNKELMQICAHCLSVPRFPLFFKCGHLTCLPCLAKYYKLNFNFKFKVRCPTCKHFGSLDEIHTYKVEKVEHPDSVSMRMYNKALFVCAHVGCGQTFPLDTINHHELYDCKQRRIHCPANMCSFISREENVISHSTQCPFHMIYCGKCDISYNYFGHKHECAIQKGNRLLFRPEHVRLTNSQLTTHEEGDVILHPHYFTDSYENNYEIQFSNFLTDARNSTTPFIFNSNAPLSGRPIRILTRQHGIIEERRHSPLRPHDDDNSANNFNFN